MFTFRWRFVGCIYWPSVRQSTPISLSSATLSQHWNREMTVMTTKHCFYLQSLQAYKVSQIQHNKNKKNALRVYRPVRELSICWSVSPSPSMREVFVSTDGLTCLACFRTLRDWSKFALASRTPLETQRQCSFITLKIRTNQRGN